MARKRAINYLNNHDIVQEIHKSKNSYSNYTEEKYNMYDIIILDINVLTDEQACMAEFGKPFNEVVEDAIITKVKRLNRPLDEKKYFPDQFTIDDIVFRLMTFDHIPIDENWPEDKVKKKPKDGYMPVNFPPFQHYIMEEGVPSLVGLSHHDKDNNFNIIQGNLTPKLGKMFMLLVEKISKKGNWRNYTYLDEMRSSALLQLSQVALQFNESRGIMLNPFAFYTTVVNNSFKRVLNIEKKVRNIRDDLLEMHGQNPSYTRQTENSMASADKEFYNSWRMPTSELRKDASPLVKAASARKKKEAIANRGSEELLKKDDK